MMNIRHGLMTGLLALFSMAASAQPTPISRDLPDGVEKISDLGYAAYGERILQLDLYRPSGITDTLPAIVVIRGGGWAAGDKEGFGPVAAALAAKGFIAVSIEYRDSSEAIFPAAVHDAKAAVRWLRAKASAYQVNPDAIGVIGGSAGAHLATYLGVTADMADLEGDGGNNEVSSTVQAVVGLATPSSLIPVGGCNAQTDNPESVVAMFLGDGCSANEGLWAYASPVTQVSSRAAPALLIHSEADTVVNFSDSLMLGVAYGRANVPLDIKLIPDAPHPFWNFNEWFQDSIDAAAIFFHRQLD